MRILFLTNFYPPHALGGEGYSCRQIADGLLRRGHQVHILTSNHGMANGAMQEEMVSRRLLLEMEFVPWINSLVLLTRRKAREDYDLRLLQQVVDGFAPELIFIWGMWNLPRSLPRLAEQIAPERVVYRFATYWPALPSQYTQYWQAPGRTPMTRVLRRLIRPLALALAPREEGQAPFRFQHMICVSEAVKRQLLTLGIDASQARIIYTGLDIAHFSQNGARNGAPREKGMRLLYSGRLAAEKGVHTVLEAMQMLNERHGLDGRISLTVAGTGDLEYVQQLHNMVGAMSLGASVTFLGDIPNEKMATLYQEYDVLVVPSIWPEPFARVVLEGMASGLAVVATAQGGTTEIIHDGANGLLFPPGDAAVLAGKVVMLYGDPALRSVLAGAGRQTVLQRFGEQRMLDQVESYLSTIVNGN